MTTADELSLRWLTAAPGSADLVWEAHGKRVTVHTTYVGDGLGSVMQAAIDLQVGSSTAIAFLPAEPSGSCVFFSDAADEVYVQIVRFSDMESEDNRWTGGVLRWHGRIKAAILIQAVRSMAEEVLARFGTLEEYSRRWGGVSFPMGKLTTLRQQDDNSL